VGILTKLYKPSLALLTDLYQLTMAYGYWKSGTADREAVFHLHFRKPPFGSGFTVACGLEAAIDFVEGFRFSDDDLQYLATLEGNDGAGTVCDVELIYGADDLHVIYSDGYYDRNRHWHSWRNTRERNWYRSNYSHSYRSMRRDSDHDGIPNRFDRDRDNDGTPNYRDNAPNNPYRR